MRAGDPTMGSSGSRTGQQLQNLSGTIKEPNEAVRMMTFSDGKRARGAVYC